MQLEKNGVLVKSERGAGGGVVVVVFSSPGLPFHPIFKFFLGGGGARREGRRPSLDPLSPPSASPALPQRPLCPRRGRGRGPGGASPSDLTGGGGGAAFTSLSRRLAEGGDGTIQTPQIIKGRGVVGRDPHLPGSFPRAGGGGGQNGDPRPLPPPTAASPERESEERRGGGAWKRRRERLTVRGGEGGMGGSGEPGNCCLFTRR